MEVCSMGWQNVEHAIPIKYIPGKKGVEVIALWGSWCLEASPYRRGWLSPGGRELQSQNAWPPKNHMTDKNRMTLQRIAWLYRESHDSKENHMTQ